ncbi:nascent polypeptide-associated complex protein [Halomarina litorea]|uniref:nascent polypeptide-associated complex protein n=1 Tax=Halomarina litorea TaxID=2961595 RepID=UPI0020C462A0|nr:nascent polypeptide-associated complex protein [Halomarina sp. BCD28]
MFGGGGGLDPRKMKQMMEQMGIDITELDAEEVIIRTPDEELVFTGADVQRMDAQGQATYQIVGEPESRPRGAGGSDAPAVESGGADAEADAGSDGDIPEADVEIVAQRTGSTKEQAREALEAEGGDLAAAVSRLE